MLIGVDYPKIEFKLLDLDLLEPNGFIGNMSICFLSLFYYYILHKNTNRNDLFLRYWNYFYLLFACCFLFGGFSHLLFNYTGIIGKIPSWLLSMFAVCAMERAILHLHPNKNWWHTSSIFRLIIFLCFECLLLLIFNIDHKPELGLIIPSLYTASCLIYSLGILGIYYKKRIHHAFHYHVFAVILLFLSSLIQLLKINIHPYFDRNDLSHLLLLVTLVLYYQPLRYRTAYRSLLPDMRAEKIQQIRL